MTRYRRLTGYLCLLMLMAPGMLLMGLAVAADYVGLGRGDSGGFGRRQAILLAVGLLAAVYGLLVHRKAVSDHRTSGRAYPKTVLFVVVPTVGMIFAAAIFVDRAIGVLQPPGCRTAGLNFPPCSTTTIETHEFSFTIESNSIGIRDHEVEPPQEGGERVGGDRQGRYRILAIGDSFTYGWGVEIDQTWPKILQRRLREAGCRVEVLNLGYPGASPRKYAEVAAESTAVLRPDLVLVAVLQGNDLRQLHTDDCDPASRANGLLKRVFPNYLRVKDGRCFQRPVINTADVIRRQWKEAAERLRDGLPAEAVRRFDRLDPKVKEALRDGNLNPCAVDLAMRHPDFYRFTLHPDRADVQEATETMAACLARIRRAAGRVGAKVEVVSVPSGAYVCEASLRTIRRLGFELDETALDDPRPDEVIQAACTTAGVPFHSLTRQIRSVAQSETLYYELDDHFNAQGQLRYGEAVADLILRGDAGGLSGRSSEKTAFHTTTVR